jgi:hypothetical protein
MAKKFLFPAIGKLVTAKTIMAVFLGIGLLSYFTGTWDFLEPMAWAGSTGLLVIEAWDRFLVKQAYYAAEKFVSDGLSNVVVIDFGGASIEDAKLHFKANKVTRVEGKLLVTQKDYQDLIMASFEACTLNPAQTIDLVSAGPYGFNIGLGMMLGLDRYNIRIWQYYKGKYQQVPTPRKEWKELKRSL